MTMLIVTGARHRIAVQGVTASRRRAAVQALAVAALVAALAGDLVHGQSAPPPAGSPPPLAGEPEPSTAPAPPGVSAPAGPGLIDKLGEWLKDSADGVASGLKGTQQRIEDINKGALDTLTRLPVAGFVTGRALCPLSANGAPDCNAGSEKLCKDKGYAAGRSLDTESSERCNPRVYLPGYQRKEGDCRIETFVIRAACQ